MGVEGNQSKPGREERERNAVIIAIKRKEGRSSPTHLVARFAVTLSC
jgi:hypothetical protein